MAIGHQQTVPSDLAEAIDEAWARVRVAPGFLTHREGRFLALVAACAPAQGTILEIGSYKGKSTVGLASIAQRYGLGPVVAVDPHSAPAVTDFGHGTEQSSWEDFQASLRRAGVEGSVEAHRAYSRELAAGWDRPIRFLWIDGDHTYRGAKEDILSFRKHLVPGAIVALHDVLHTFEGPVRVFAEEILPADDFGPAGLCGSIGWAQYRPQDGARWSSRRRALARRLHRLIPFVRDGRQPVGLAKLRYKLWRGLVPHAAVDPAAWVRAIS
ncbi:MAG TPA: class I SAM-dependent methyltransferase [Gemmatimonadales bacterium]|nr:class I SAM-dependent methyltransferase [Gemmatimonadales bacterium]